MGIIRAVLCAYHAADHSADVQPLTGPSALLAGLPVLASCPAALLVPGRLVAVVLWPDVGGLVLGPYDPVS